MEDEHSYCGVCFIHLKTCWCQADWSTRLEYREKLCFDKKHAYDMAQAKKLNIVNKERALADLRRAN